MCLQETSAEQNKKNAIVKCIKMLGLKNPEALICNPDGSYSHVNTKKRKRTFVAFYGWSGYLERKRLYPDYLKYWKVNGYYVFEICGEKCD